MAVQFIIGPAGSGKSSYVQQQIVDSLQAERRKKLIIMVPEQATFCYQYELINQHHLPGVLTLEILSFQRLARTVMQQTGGLACHPLDDLGRLLLLRRLLQEHTECYPFLQQSINRPSYLLKIGQALQDFKRYQISSQRLQQVIEEQELPQTLFTCKLRELSALYNQYDAYLAQDYLDSEDALELLLDRLEQQVLFADTEIWVDEFYDFTPQEMAILGALMKQAACVHIVLPADRQEQDLGRQMVFHNTAAILRQLRQLAQKQRVPILPDIICGEPLRWQQTPDLRFLEQQYFAAGTAVWQGAPVHLALLQGQNRMAEVDGAAREIRRLCREKGYHYNEIGIFTRGDQYQLLLETVLTDYEIPYFVDHKAPVHQHPLTELLLSAFDIIGSGWSYQSMFRFLKTDLLPFAQEDLDLLENYVLQYGIGGSSWYQAKEWSYGAEEPEVLTRINDLRRQIAAPLRRLQLAAVQPQTAVQLVQALYVLLEAYEVPQRLEQLCRQALEQNLLETVQVHQQIWDRVIQIFDQITQLLQDAVLTAGDFAVLLHAAFDNLDLGLLPNSLDQVFIGSLSHSRSRNLRAVFVLGLNEGIFPAKAEQDGFFHDGEKQALKELGLELSPDSGQQLYGEQFLIYLALTRASEYLSFSYSLSDEDGKALRPSGIVNRLRRLYPALKETAVQWPPGEEQALLPYFVHPYKAMGLLGSHLATAQRPEQQELWAELYNWFLAHPTPLFRQVCGSLQHEEQLQSRQLHDTQIYGTPLHLSVSALEKYRQCPYSYFLTYGLRLKERPLYKMEAVDVGQFYHAAIEQFSDYLLEQQLTWQSLEAVQVKEIMRQIVDQLAPAIQNEILFSTGRYQYLRHRLQKTLERSALLLMEHGKHGDFMPVALESEFGTAKGKLPRWQVTLQDGTRLTLQGRIDRIEQASQDGRHYLRVIDFKTGVQGLRLTDVYYGLKIQLLTYLQVALQYYQQLVPAGEQVLPAGVLYYFFRSGIISTDGPVNAQEAEALHISKLKADGLLVADMRALKLAQRDLDAGSSTLLPLSLLKKALPYLEDAEAFEQLEDPLELFGKRNTTVVTRAQLELLLRHVKGLITSFGEAIHNGRIAVRPCRMGQFIGCQYCSYQAICQIETVDILKNSEELLPLEREEIWRRLKQEKGGKRDAHMDDGTAASN